MPQSYFIWNGVDCRSMGILLAGPAAIIRPEERVNHVQIPGRSGDLTETEGEDIYNSYIQTVTIHGHGGYRMREIFSWLRGSGYVTFSGEPDRRQQARIIGAITLNKHSRNLDWWSGEVQFYCQPLKELLKEDSTLISTSGAVLRNYGDVTCKPLILIVTTTGDSGACSLTITDSASQAKTISLTGLNTYSPYWIDCETMEVLNYARTGTLTQRSSGEFPVMRPGANTITFTGLVRYTITKRERYL